jgi:4-hydroxy-tetrahydrodipicolinate reductase
VIWWGKINPAAFESSLENYSGNGKDSVKSENSGETIRVAVSGAAGRMGREVVRAVVEAEGLTLAAAIDKMEVGADSGVLAGVGANAIAIEADLDVALTRTQPDVLVDFTLPAGVMSNLITALAHGVAPVVGTTGLSEDNLTEIDRLAKEKNIGAFVAPNFAIGAVLMMQFAAQAAKYMPDVEIIELHHDRKLDSPSGTALLTAQRIGEARREAGVTPLTAPSGLVEKASGARGARAENTGDVPVHSVRLPGFVAHQEVIFGGPGQVLTLRHDSIDRRSFMPGVILSVRKVGGLTGLVIGLENLL